MARMNQTIAGVKLTRTIADRDKQARRWVARIGSRTYAFEAMLGWYNRNNVTSWRAYACDAGGLHHIDPNSPFAFFTEKTNLNDAVLDCIEDELNVRDWQSIRTRATS